MNRRIGFLMIAVCMLATQPAWAQSNLGLKSGGVAVSMVSPENIDASFGIGVFADHGTIAPRWGIESRLDWWSHSESAFGMDASISDVTLGARTKYQFPVSNPTLQPFAGFGVGMHFLSAEVVALDPFTGTAFKATSSESRVGFDFGGGIQMPMSPGMNFVGEGWYSIVSDFNQFSLRAGISRNFGR